VGCAYLPASSRAAEVEPGFSSVFNGTTFDGLYLKVRTGDEALAKKLFAIEEGTIHAFNDSFPDEYKLNTGENDTHGMVYTQSAYTNYILRFDYKWGTRKANNFGQWQYDAGVYYHVIDDKIWPVGIEYQIRYDHTKVRNHTGDLIRSGGTAYQWCCGTDQTYLHPDNGGTLQTKKGWLHYAKPTTQYHGLDDQWNQCELIVMGSEYAIHKLNGEVVNMAFNLKPTAGKIGFQAETAEISYRNIRIKEFGTAVPASEFLK
jgi:hypothetical protein